MAVRERQVLGKTEDNAVLFDETGKGYEITYRGARVLDPKLLQRYLDSTPRNFFYILRERLKEPGLVFEFQGSDVVLNDPVNIVDIIDSENRVVTVYFHFSTKLPVRQKFFRRDPESKERIEELSEFSKFRDVGGGVKWPFAIRKMRDGEKIFEIYSESVQINKNLNDSLFTLPADVKVLSK